MDTSDARHTVQADKLAKSIVYVMLQMERYARDEEGVKAFRVRGPRWEGDEYMIVCNSVDGDGAVVVGFHTASTLTEVLTGLGNRLRNGTMKWHVDKYAQSVDNS